MRYLKYLTSIIFLCFSVQMLAQEDIKVESFAISTTTNYANLKDYIVYDNNGEKCALIIVDTKYPELLTFDGGSTGIKKVIPKTGQVWVYVPEGLKRITISGKGIGTLREYDLGISVSKARTYILKLTTKDVSTVVFNDSLEMRMLIKIVSERDNTPISDADFSLNGIKQVLNDKGVLEKDLIGASYRYRVESKFFKTTSGTFVVDGSKSDVLIRMKPNYEIISINAQKGSEIWIDGELMGTNSWTGKLTYGTHNVTCKQKNHYDLEQTITVAEGKNAEFSLDNLKEIQGTLNITSTPSGANVLIDGKQKGTTPYKEDLIIGNYKIEVVKGGYTSYLVEVAIKENQQESINAVLKQTHKVAIVTYPSKVSVTLDGMFLGYSPLGVDLRSGTHNFKIEADGYYPLKKKEKIGDNQTTINFRLRQLKFKPIELYAGYSYNVMPISAWSVFNGAYIKNINFELGYGQSLKASEPIYWHASNTDIRPIKATYGNRVFKVRLGYGFILNNTFRITPQVGLSYLVLRESTETEQKIAGGSNSFNLSFGAKIDVAITRWAAFSIVPEYSMGLIKSDGYKALEKMSSQIKNMSNGLGVHASFSVRY